MMKHNFARLIAVILVFTLSLIASCSAANTNVAVSNVLVRLGFGAWPGYLPWQVATEKNLFANHNVQVQTKWFDNYTESMNALKAQQIEANSQTLNDTISAVAAGADQVIVLTYNYSEGNDMLIVRKGINTITDLKGKKVAAEEGTVYHFFLSVILERAGLSLSDVNFVPLELGKCAPAFVASQVDAVVVSTPFTTQALKLAGSKPLASSKDFPGLITDHLVFTRQFIQEHPEKVQAVVDTWFDTLKYIESNPSESLAIMAKQANVTVDEYKEYDSGIHILNLQENITAFQNTNDFSSLPFNAQTATNFLVKGKFVKAKPDLTRLFDDRFVKAHAEKLKAIHFSTGKS